MVLEMFLKYKDNDWLCFLNTCYVRVDALGLRLAKQSMWLINRSRTLVKY